MRFEGIDFPSPIIEAQEKGDLVVFAGAGVSMPSPSDLPNFSLLANELADGTAVLKKDEAIDRFLGRLPPHLNIYERTKALLQVPTSKPNSLHRDLIKIFVHPSAVRLVTTNFDDHFANAALEFFKVDLPEMFFAPALPVGENFSGIVHLHGSVQKVARRMVLTDSDFGRAYLTEGWARRFVQDLFLKYTVLFIGYSHEDPVMHYIARGLPPIESGQKRFALGIKGTESFWDNLGIRLLPYSKRRSANPHVQLQLACGLWANHVLSSPLENRERIKQIVEKPPSPTGDEIDLIEKSLRSVTLVSFFTDCADSIEWLQWIENRDAFKRLFLPLQANTKCDEALGWWFANKYAVKHPGYALDLIRRNGSRIPRLLCQSITRAIWMAVRTGHEVKSLDKWIPILILNDPVDGFSFLDYILSSLHRPDQFTSSMMLFNYLTRPWVQLTSSLSKKVLDPAGGPDVAADLRIRGEVTYLSLSWTRLKTNDFPQHVHEYIALATSHLEEATLLFRAYGSDYTGWDPISVNLPSLGSPNITLTINGLNILVDIARHSLEWLIENEPKRALTVIDSWAFAQSLTLKRLALYGVALTEAWTPDHKLSWLLSEELIYAPGMSEEVAMVLESSFAPASEDNKILIAQTILDGPEETDERIRDHRIYALLLKIQGTAPEHTLVTQGIQALRQKHPELVPDPTQDKSSLSGPPWGYLPFDATSLLSRPVSETLTELVEFKQTNSFGPGRDDVVQVLRQAVQENPEWGLEFAKALKEKSDFKSDLWSGLIHGWNTPQLSTEQWHAVLTLLSENPEIVASAVYETVTLLERGVSQESGGIKGLLSPLAANVGLHAWSVLVPRDWRHKESKEWLATAINDPAGILMQFQMRLLAEEYRSAGSDWKGLTRHWNDYFTAIAHGNSWSDAMARIILASQIQVLFDLDEKWTIAELYESFDFKIDALRAAQVWHGFLYWGRWSNKFLETFLPFYVALFPDLGNKLGKSASQFCNHMAGIALYSNINPLKGWLKQFIREITPEERNEWAHDIGTLLDSVPNEKLPDLWSGWMKPYWQKRLQGVPLLLSGTEVGAMVEWSVRLKGEFPEVVSLILQGPSPSLENSQFVYYQLQNSKLAKQYPNEFAALLEFLVTGAPPTYHEQIAEMVRALIPTAAERSLLVSIAEKLAELWYPGAPDLKKQILGSDKPDSLR